MRRHQITDDEVRLCIEQPEETEPSISGRTNYTRTYRGLPLRVTAIQEDDLFVIITVTLRD